MDRISGWFRETFVDSTTPEQFEDRIRKILAAQEEQERLQTKAMTKQAQLIRKIPTGPAEQARRMREWKKYKQMQMGLERRSNAIQRLENILHQITTYHETVQEAKLAQSLPQMMARFDMPSISSIERDMENMQQLVMDGQEVSSLVNENLQMSAMTMASGSDVGGTDMSYADPTMLEDELQEFLDACQQSDESLQMQSGKETASISSALKSVSADPLTLDALPRVPPQRTSRSSGQQSLDKTLNAFGWL